MVKNNNPLVSVIMPVFNGEKTILLALESLKLQSYKNWKCYIINDGSTDSTKDILDNLDDSRFIIIHLEMNQGRSKARQIALDLVEGEYLTFLDADDFYHVEKLKKQLQIFNDYPQVDLVSCGMGCYDDNFDLITVKGNKKIGPEMYKISMHFYPARAPSMIRLPKAKTIKYNGKLKYAEDTDYFTRYINNNKYYVTNEILYYYSEFTSVNSKKILDGYLSEALRGMYILYDYPFSGFKIFILSIMKWFYINIKIFFVNHNELIKSRGLEAEIYEKEKFSTNLKTLKKDYE